MISEYRKQLVRKVSALSNTEPSLRHIPHLPKHPSCCAPTGSSHGITLIIQRWSPYDLFICLEKMAFRSCPAGMAATDLVAIQVKSTSWHPQHKSTANSFRVNMGNRSTKSWAEWPRSMPVGSGHSDSHSLGLCVMSDQWSQVIHRAFPMCPFYQLAPNDEEALAQLSSTACYSEPRTFLVNREIARFLNSKYHTKDLFLKQQ